MKMKSVKKKQKKKQKQILDTFQNTINEMRQAQEIAYKQVYEQYLDNAHKFLI